MPTVATFNVNSIRARQPVVEQWLDITQTDIVCLQELKATNEQVPVSIFEERGYHFALHGQPRYNGVAILSKLPMTEVITDFHGTTDWANDARFISAVIGGIRYINTYVPNGNTVNSDKWFHKMRWLEYFHDFVHERGWHKEPMVWLGDINIAPTENDLFEPKGKLGNVGYHPDEHSRLAKIVDLGLTDVFREQHDGPGHYTFWEYMIPNGFKRNLGWRIDHIYVTEKAKEVAGRCWIDLEPRGWERPSDHTPVCLQVN